MLILLYIILGFIPGLAWLLIFLRKDKERPEPRKMILKVFLWGMLVTPIAIVLELVFVRLEATLFLFLIVGPVEELLKYWVFKRQVARAPAYDEPVDAMIYMITAAMGFASVENIIVILNHIGNPVEVIILRFLSATLLHALASGIVGYWLGAKKPVVTGLALAIIFHGVYNYLATSQYALASILLIGLLFIMFIVNSIQFNKLKKIKGVKIYG